MQTHAHMSQMHGFITPADSSSTSLGIGLSITLKAERGIPSRSSVVRAPAAQAGGPGFDPQWLPRIFSLSAGLY